MGGCVLNALRGRGRDRYRGRLGAPLTVGFLAAAILVGPFIGVRTASAAGIPPCNRPGQITPHPLNWYSIKAPVFPAGPQTITHYAVEPLVAERLYVTNGVSVMRSTDSGCNWSESYTLPDGEAGLNSSNGEILEIEVSAPGTVYLPIQQNGTGARPHVMVTRDAGATWTDASGPAVTGITGSLLDFDASLGNPAAAAMLVEVELGEAGAGLEGDPTLLVTSTAGETWEPRHPNVGEVNVTTPVVGGTTNINGLGDIDSITMNPVAPNEIWLYGAAGVYHSDGTNLTPVDIGPTRVLDIALDGGAIVAYPDGAPSGGISFDGGQSFESFSTGLSVSSVDVVSGSPSLGVVGAQGRVFQQIVIPGQPAMIGEFSPLDGRYISDITFALSGSIANPSVYGTTGATIEVAYEPAPKPVDTEKVLAAIVPPPKILTNYLQPASERIVMRPGQSRTLDYDLGLPAAVTPLDVYFMIDISGSMGGAINGVRSGMREIADRLDEDGGNVWFGVGAFRAYGDPPAYDRVRDIAPPTGDLAAALNSLDAQGGGAETQMAALLQSVTGTGDQVIPPGLNMHFRPGSLRVAIEVTDEVISQGGQHPPHTEVSKALRDAGVKMVGLAIQEEPLLRDYDYDDPGEPAGVLQQVAAATGASAPVSGVDCDGDGDLELQAEDPLVCLLPPSNVDDAELMADAIVGVLDAIEDIQDLTVSVVPAADVTAESSVVSSVEPTLFPQVDLKEANARQFSVTVRCPSVPRRTTYPLRVAVSRSTGPLEDAALSVVCVPRQGEEFVPAISPFVPVALVPPPPPRPPDPIPEPNPNPNPQQNPQAQAGFAAQEQQQPQVAVAHQEGPGVQAAQQGATDDYLMSARKESKVPPVGFVFAAGAITSLYAYAAVSRSKVRTAHARGKRRK